MGNRGIIYTRTVEVEKVARWRRGEISEQDYQEAQEWRDFIKTLPQVAGQILDAKGDKQKFATLNDVKKYSDHLIYNVYKNNNRGELLRFVLDRFGIIDEHKQEIMRRWKASEGKALVDFAPYTAHVILVELFLDIAIAAGLIGAKRQTNRIDAAYLYYLPFTEIFISTDRLHKRIESLFIDSQNQLFVTGEDMNAYLEALINHYTSHPDLETCGLIKLAEYPPTEGKFKICDIYDQFCDGWREHANNPIQITPQLQAYMKDLIAKSEKNIPQTPEPGAKLATEIFERHITTNKYGWHLRPK